MYLARRGHYRGGPAQLPSFRTADDLAQGNESLLTFHRPQRVLYKKFKFLPSNNSRLKEKGITITKPTLLISGLKYLAVNKDY